MNRNQITAILKHVATHAEPCAYCVHHNTAKSCAKCDYNCDRCADQCACCGCGEEFAHFELKKLDELTDEPPKDDLNGYPVMPLRSNEVNSLMELHYLQIATAQGDRYGGSLRRRLMQLGEWERFCSINMQIRKILTKCLCTLSKERYDYIMRYSKANCMAIKPNTSCVMGTTNDFAAVKRRTIRDLMAGIQKDVCSICQGEPSDMAKCKYRNAIKELSLVDTEHYEEQDGFCIGQTADWLKESLGKK